MNRQNDYKKYKNLTIPNLDWQFELFLHPKLQLQNESNAQKF